jgi:hypothetical protein
MESKKVSVKIEEGIDTINRKVMSLKKDDWRRLSEELLNLRRYMHDFEYWLDNQIRTQIEAEAKRKAKSIAEAGFSFDKIVIDKVEFYLGDDRSVTKNRPDDDIPF